MGGTMSMLHWAIGYDPIVEGVERACGVAAPTFVDDLAALPIGPRHTMATELFLVAAAHSAGLLLDGHECEWMTCDWLDPAAHAALASLPARLRRTAAGWDLRGVRPHLLRAILEDQIGPAWGTGIRLHAIPCQCGTKTAVVPQADLRGWQAALAHSPFGASSVVPFWQYLGVTIVSPAPAAPAPGTWTLPALTMLRHGTWARATTRLRERVLATLAVPGSTGQRARQWNTYMASVLTYPAQVCLPLLADCRWLE